MLTKGEQFTQKYIQELRSDPVTAAREILGVELAPHERITLRGMWEYPWVLNVWGRGTGKTFMDALFISLRAVLYPGSRIVVVGPGFRQAQLVFKEVERFDNPVFTDSWQGGPKHHTSDWILDFKNGSFIAALPLGTDGAKIRGYRANVLIIDEMVQVPPEIIDKVCIPFMATEQDPLAEYLGLDAEKAKNTLVYSTSAYYTFNHGYQKYCNFLVERYRNNNTDYFVTSFNYDDTPKGFINMKVVEMARKQSTDADFRTEWRGEWVSDTAGFYPASLVESCRNVGIIPEMRGKAGEEYVLGVDPATVSNTCGFVIVKIGSPYKFVHIASLGDTSYPEICSRILDYMTKFNIVRIGLDRGAGLPVLDLFAEGRIMYDAEGSILKKTKLLEIDDTTGQEGKRIIQTIKATSEGVTEINFGMKASMEAGSIVWPATAGDAMVETGLQERETISEEIRQMEAEFRMIEATPTRSGYFSFNVPSHRNKDRYSAALMALAAAKAYVGEDKNKTLPAGFWRPESAYSQYYL
jgi:hypothetical protein